MSGLRDFWLRNHTQQSPAVRALDWAFIVVVVSVILLLLGWVFGWIHFYIPHQEIHLVPSRDTAMVGLTARP